MGISLPSTTVTFLDGNNGTAISSAPPIVPWFLPLSNNIPSLSPSIFRPLDSSPPPSTSPIPPMSSIKLDRVSSVSGLKNFYSGLVGSSSCTVTGYGVSVSFSGIRGFDSIYPVFLPLFLVRERPSETHTVPGLLPSSFPLLLIGTP